MGRLRELLLYVWYSYAVIMKVGVLLCLKGVNKLLTILL